VDGGDKLKRCRPRSGEGGGGDGPALVWANHRNPEENRHNGKKMKNEGEVNSMQKPRIACEKKGWEKQNEIMERVSPKESTKRGYELRGEGGRSLWGPAGLRGNPHMKGNGKKLKSRKSARKKTPS